MVARETAESGTRLAADIGRQGSIAVMTAEPSKPELDGPFRTWISRIRVLGILLWAGFFFALLIYQSLHGELLPKNWFLQMVQQHPASTIGIGISAISAFFIVAVLELTTAAVQFEVLGFKFHGAAGQVVLCVLCFLSMVFATWLLWDKAWQRGGGKAISSHTLFSGPGKVCSL